MARDEHFNRLTPAGAESLALLAEEAGEVVQAACKALRHGLTSCNPDDASDTTNAEHLNKEIGDLLAAVDIAIGLGYIDRDSIESYRRGKLSTVRRWLHHATIPSWAARHIHRFVNDVCACGARDD